MTDMKSYAVVTAAYWSFTLTDGALRMLILLHFHALGYSPFKLATLFLLYEFMGILTNLVGGWLASQFGLRLTLFTGLLLQTFSLLALSMLNSNWSQQFSIVFVLCIQGLSGVAKDLSKMSSKSAIKLAANKNTHSTLFKWTAFLTGSKNALKGLGFFIGSLLLAKAGFQTSLLIMSTYLGIILIFTKINLTKSFGGNLSKTKFSSILSKTQSINFLSIARALLFGSRDVWFVVGLPVFLYDVLNWNFETIGIFFAGWVIGYGTIQSLVPRFFKQSSFEQMNEIHITTIWTYGLCFITIILAAAFYIGLNPLICVVVGLSIFGFIFAINSSLHSFLILALTKTSDVTLNVGFYYMANAVGRFLGTLLSGITYQIGGLFGCLIVASIMIGLSGFFIGQLRQFNKISPSSN